MRLAQLINMLDRESKLQLGINIACAVITTCLWLFVLIYIRRGYEIADGGFYLLSYRNYDYATMTISEFEALNKIFYDVAGKSTTRMRSIGGILLLLTSTFTAITLTTLYPQNSEDDKSFSLKSLITSERFALLCLIISGGALFYVTWIPTPSYNWSNLFGLLLFWAGMVIWLDTSRPQRSALGVCLVGFAAGIIFWSRGMTAALLPLLLIGVLLLHPTRIKAMFRKRHFVFGIMGLAIGLSIPTLVGDPPHISFQKMALFAEYKTIRQPTNGNILRLLENPQDKLLEVVILVIMGLHFGILLITTGIIIILSRIIRARPNLKKQLMILIEIAFVVMWFGNWRFLNQYIGGWWLSVYVGTLIALFVAWYANRIISQPTNVRAYYLVFSVLFAITPLIFIVSAFASYAIMSSLANIFTVIAISMVLVLLPLNMTRLLRTLIPVSLCVQILILMVMTSQHPYRQNVPVYEMHSPANLRLGQETVLVAEDVAIYLNQLQAQAQDAGFQARTPVIDMTGVSPGAVYALDGITYGFQFLFGGFGEGSDASVYFILSHWEQSELERAWILTDENNHRTAISLDILDDLGLDFPTDYVKVGEVLYPYFNQTQALWKPIEP